MIYATIVGSDTLIEKLGLAPSFAKAELRKAVDLMAMKALVRVKLKLSDDVLRVRTGRLRRSITQKVTEDHASIIGTVGTNVSYGAAWELGFDRKVGAGARGGPRGLSGPAMAAYQAKHPPGVKHYPPRSFLATSLAELEPEFKDLVSKAVAKGLKL